MASCQQRGERQVGTHQPPPLLCVSLNLCSVPTGRGRERRAGGGHGEHVSLALPVPFLWEGRGGEDRLHLTGPVVPAKKLAACAKRLGEALARALWPPEQKKAVHLACNEGLLPAGGPRPVDKRKLARILP